MLSWCVVLFTSPTAWGVRLISSCTSGAVEICPVLVNATCIGYKIIHMVGRAKLKQNLLAVLKCLFLIMQWYGDLSSPKNCGFCLGHVKGGIWKLVFFLQGRSRLQIRQQKHLHSWPQTSSFMEISPFPSCPCLCYPKKDSTLRDTRWMTLGLLHRGQWLCLAMRLTPATPRLLPPELLFIISLPCRDIPLFSAQVASHVSSPSTATSGGHGQKQGEMTSCANQRGWAFLQPPA